MCDGARWCFLPIIWFLIYALSFFKDHKNACAHFTLSQFLAVLYVMICYLEEIRLRITFNSRIILGELWSHPRWLLISVSLFCYILWIPFEKVRLRGKKSLFKFYGPGAFRDHTIWLLSQILFYKEYLCYHVRYLCIITI